MNNPHSKKIQAKEYKPKVTSNTSWGSVATWYDSHLKDDSTYHAKVILPSLLRLLGDVQGKHILDLACGQGYFAKAFKEKKAHVIGVDISKELIALAEKEQEKSGIHASQKVMYFATPSHDLYMVKDKSQDLVVCVLALQNIENIHATIQEVTRTLKQGGKFIFVINHPAFRIPKESGWGYDEQEHKQYRRIDAYLSESKVKMDMTPGSTHDKKFTISFHRPLQYWFKILGKNGFAVTRMEEWESHKESEKGPRQAAENKARKEIPLFLMVEAIFFVKIKEQIK